MELTPRPSPLPPALAPLALEAGAVDVVICCYTDRRWTDLLAALRSCLVQGAVVRQIIAVVDHNPSLARRLAEEGPKGIAIVENRQARGLSGARNTGVEVSQAPIVLFLDDDAVADPDLADVLAARVAQAGVMGAGATIRPDWGGPAPDWFPPEFLWTVGCTYEGLRPGPVRNLLGAAMAVRRAMLVAAGPFDDGLGRTAAALPMGCEETAFCIRAGKSYPQGSFVYEDAAGCAHRVTRERASRRYLLRRCWAEGLSKEALAHLVGPDRALASERAYLTRTLPRALVRGLADVVRRRRPAGLARSFTVIAGLAAAATAYGFARLRRMSQRPVATRRLADARART